MENKFSVEIITPEKSILKSDTTEVIIPSYEGEMGILKDHISLITFLRPGLVTIKNSGEKRFYIEEGTVEFLDNNLLILTSTATELENFKKEKIKEILEEAENLYQSNNLSDKEKYLTSYKIETLKTINS